MWAHCRGKRGSAGDKGCVECCSLTASVECAMMHGAEVGGDAAGKAGVRDEGGGGDDDGAAQETVHHPPHSWR